MYNTVHQYDLSFVPPQRGTNASPELVITLLREHLPELDYRLHRILEYVEVEVYLGRDEPFFPVLLSSSGKTEFGFGNCGLLVPEGETISLCIRLTPDVARRALTLNLLAQALIVPFERYKEPGDSFQQVDIETRCSPSAGTYGYEHAVEGYISMSMYNWLKEYAQRSVKNVYDHAPLPEKVITAMRQAWSAMALGYWKKWITACSGYVAEDGRFSLQCFGDACDLAIYPDQSLASTRESLRFGCHNLDHAVQQLTLVSGLAQLCQLVREE